MKKHVTALGITFLVLVIASCPLATTSPTNENTNDMPYKLNVVYFIPTDIEAPAEYERRISELMLWLQNFYAQNMEKNGFGKRTFGLRTLPNDRINLITINGQSPSTNYPYEGGSGNVIQEIDAYFAANPEQKESEHSLIIIPSYSGDSLKPGGPPFYGTGRNCYALDYEFMDIKYLGEQSEKGTLLSKWFGGLAHELGHGLNLPHNSQWASQLNDPNFGTTLMGAGNLTLGQSPTYLSKASAAILNNAQVFATKKKLFYQPNSTVELKRFSIEHTPTTINVQSAYKNATKPVNAINIYIDDFPYSAVNEDYDAESWSITNLPNNEFNIEIPLHEITISNDKFRVRTVFLFNDGTTMTENHDFSRTNLEDYSFTPETDMPKTNWQIETNNYEPSSPATKLLDNDIDTIWHSQWSTQKPAHPHIITVDMNEAKTIRGLSFVQRQSLHGAIKEFQLEISADGIRWQSPTTHKLLAVARKQFIYLPQASAVKEFRITTISNYTSFDPDIATLAEIGSFE